jgi:hypothetical protein
MFDLTMKTIRIIAIVGLILCAGVPFVAFDHLMATRSEAEGHRVIGTLAHLTPTGTGIVNLPEADVFWLKTFAENEWKRDWDARMTWCVTAVLCGVLFLGIMLTTMRKSNNGFHGTR